MLLDYLKNKTIFADKYQTNSEAVIISCFFNPQNSAYRIKAFNHFYDSIKHLNHRIIECVIGDAKPQLEESESITRVYTENLLWHKESLLNKIVSELPEKYKYVFWVDADVIFTNKNWLTDGVKALQTNNIIQPFEYCAHMEINELEPSFSIDKITATNRGKFCPNGVNNKVWKSFASNCSNTTLWQDRNYNIHGHVGFAWGARREVLEAVPLYDRALIGGADHVICHAAMGQINCDCIAKSFIDNIEEVNEWSRQFYKVVQGKVGYVQGNLYHIWHGDINKREYLKRIQDFTPKTKNITNKDKNGLYITHKDDEVYMRNYFSRREVSQNMNYQDDGFLQSMALGYITDSAIIGSMGGNMAGAIIGEMLNNDQNDQNNAAGGGGDFGGGGSGGSWPDNSDSTSVDNSNTPGFSVDNFS